MIPKKTIGEMTELVNPSQELKEFQARSEVFLNQLVEKERLREDIKSVTKLMNELKRKLLELEGESK